MRSLLACLILLMLSACGTKTPLMIPPGRTSPPLFGTATPPPAPPVQATLPKSAESTSGTTADDNKPTQESVSP